MTVSIRKAPYPWKSVLAINSDIDATAPVGFEKMHKFINSTSSQPDYLDGVGLDVGDTFFWKNTTTNGTAVYEAKTSYPTEDDYANQTNGTVDAANARDAQGYLQYPAWRDHFKKYIQSGWVDSIHGGDNLSDDMNISRGAVIWDRKDGEQYRDWLASFGANISVYVLHSNVNSNFGSWSHTLGDNVGDSHYWADYCQQAGFKYGWMGRLHHSADLPIDAQALTLDDGTKYWNYSRYWNPIYNPRADTFDLSLSATELDKLVAAGIIQIFYTHLGIKGAGGDYNSGTAVMLDNGVLPASCQTAFQRLREYQNQGKILNTRTSRALKLNNIHNSVSFETVPYLDGEDINILSVIDAHTGNIPTTIEDLRGLTFVCDDANKTRLRINGTIVPESELVRGYEVNPVYSWDEIEQDNYISGYTYGVIGIKWFDYDRTDYTQTPLNTDPVPLVTGSLYDEVPSATYLTGAPGFTTDTYFNLEMNMFSEAEPVAGEGFINFTSQGLIETAPSPVAGEGYLSLSGEGQLIMNSPLSGEGSLNISGLGDATTKNPLAGIGSLQIIGSGQITIAAPATNYFDTSFNIYSVPEAVAGRGYLTLSGSGSSGHNLPKNVAGQGNLVISGSGSITRKELETIRGQGNLVFSGEGLGLSTISPAAGTGYLSFIGTSGDSGIKIPVSVVAELNAPDIEVSSLISNSILVECRISLITEEG